MDCVELFVVKHCRVDFPALDETAAACRNVEKAASFGGAIMRDSCR
jgi:hypothetical protein